MVTTVRASFTPAAALRLAKTGAPRLNASRRALVVRATAGESAFRGGQIMGGAMPASAKRSVVDSPPLYRRPIAGAEVSDDLKSLEIMRKFSEQYAKR